jgi:KaiC/GvpD/RAD55 family RecA-like ATPase
MKSVKKPIEFGIPHLDDLIRPHSDGGDPTEAHGVQIVCIQGPVGCGKSTLCLHAVSEFIAKGDDDTKALFISTDLRFQEAKDVWTSFRLSENSGQELCEIVPDSQPTKSGRLSSDVRDLADWLSDGSLRRSPKMGRVGFLDLSSVTLGDEWGLVERVVAQFSVSDNRALIVVDSLSGLDVLATRSSERSSQVPSQEHINRLIPLLKHRANLLFTARKDDPTALRIREEAQADIAYEMGFKQLGDATFRTIKVVKARSFRHSLDDHLLLMRGTDSYSSSNLDLDIKQPWGGRQIPYIDVVPSISSLLDVIKAAPGKTVRDKTASTTSGPSPLSAFGVQFLDPMLVESDRPEVVSESHATPSRSPHGMQNTIKGDRFGVEAGAVVRLIGPSRTYKSDLALGFLRYTFAQPFRTLLALLETLSSKGGARVLPRYPQGPEITQLARYREVMRTDFFIGHYSKTSRLGVKELRVRIAKGLAQSPPKHAKLSSRNKEFFDANLTSQIGDRASEISLNILAILSDPSMMRVGILFTARFHEFDVLVESFAKRLCDHYQEYVSVLDRSELLRNRLKLPPAVPVAVLCELILKALIRKGLLYRRVSLNELTPSLVFHSLRRYLQVARKAIEPLRTKVEESKAKLNRDLSFHEPPSWQMRLVIDDLSAFRLPGGEDFDAFQSLLASYLRRNGVTTLLVESVSSEPGVLPVAVNRKSTMDRSPTIRTMRLRFAHGERVAITVEPPLNDDYYGILRELRLMQSNHGMVPIVDPNLELYSNLQEGRPKLVPLEVRLFNETIGCKRYLEETDKFLVEFLGGRDSEAEQLLVSAKGISLSDYDVLKDLCATPQLATLTKTLVVQVDGFWNLRPGGDLRNMKDYLTRSLLLKSQKSSDLEDQFSMFKPSLANSEIDNSGLNEQHVGAARLEYFQIPFRARSGAAPTYATRLSRSHPGMDRVPYTWDFGFLLCRRDLWYRQISRSQSGSHGDSPSQLLERLRIGSPARTSNQRGKQQPHVSWFDFLRVAEMVARSSAEATGSVVPILDLGEESPNSIDSLVLEIWFSEILAELTNPGGAKTGPTRHEFLKTVAGDLRHGMAEPNGSSKAPVLAGGLLSLLSPWGDAALKMWRIHEEAPIELRHFNELCPQIGRI